MRYEIYAIEGGMGDTYDEVTCQGNASPVHSSEEELGYEDLSEIAHSYHYGVVVIDTEEQTMDWGSEITDYDGKPPARAWEWEDR